MFELKPDFEEVAQRFYAWWDGDIIDRAVTGVTFPKTKGESDAEGFLRVAEENRKKTREQLREERLDPRNRNHRRWHSEHGSHGNRR